MKLKGIIWDLDGVLIDSEGQHIELEIETAKKYGIHLTPEITKEYLGVRLEEYFRDIARRFNPDVQVGEMIREHKTTLRRYYMEVFGLMPYCFEVLLQLKGRYRMAIATSRERELAQIVLDRFLLTPFFSTFVYGEEVSRGKPDPQAFQRAAALLEIDPPSVVVVEDSVIGLSAAKKGGFPSIAYRATHNEHLDFSSADAVVEDLREIPPLLDRMKMRSL
ncbi:MAG: hypothetical protein AMS17_03395 [Spirochaetes bacterium DG_61]|jgi:HAD superfamily hydrolase (TIGR01509 family)|nr:MAG: hypothetical protein AMS17_03395 [Spirochaetes bacterium DG_61]